MRMCSLPKETDECIAERFRRDYNEQFNVLVRMHLSFLLDLNTDENEAFTEKGKFKKWNIVSFGKKLKIRGVMEGAPLTQEGICQVYQLIEYLRSEENLKSEGIFRRTGSLERQQDLRNMLNQGITLQLEGGIYSVHDCASVLKGFLAELPDPLLTEAHFPVYCQIAETCGVNQEPTQEGKLLQAIQLLLLLLPSENKVLLKDILELLHMTASYESFNRMSPDNLAKLFTPHLLCPRKLTPEALLKDSQTLFKIITFMIKNAPEVFKVPPKLVLDFRARYEKKKVLSPSKRLNESVSDAASTVFTFVDHERTAKENEANPTEKALAQLYAHIQSLPESSKKRKLVKQFNRENGQGTPLQAARYGTGKNRSFGDSIKKHIFQKSLAKKKVLAGITPSTTPSSGNFSNTPSSSPSLITKTRLFCHHNHESSAEGTPAKKLKKSCLESVSISSEEKESNKESSIEHDSSTEDTTNVYLTSTPACLTLRACPDIVFTPDHQDRKSMSPITRSTQRMTRAMQETMMTPRSRKPVLLVSGTNINALPRFENQHCPMDDVTEECGSSFTEDVRSFSEERPDATFSTEKPTNVLANFVKSKSESDIIDMKCQKLEKLNRTDSPSTSLSDTFKEYLGNRNMITLSSPFDSSFSSRTDDFNSTDFQDISDSRMSDSLLYCLNGNNPDEVSTIDIVEDEERKLVLKPKQFDKSGKPIIFETSF